MTPPPPSCAPPLLPEGDAYFTVKLQDYTAVEKDQVVLECELNKEVDVIWYRNQAEVRPSKTVAVRAEGRRRTLVLRRVGHEDAGHYTCDCGTDKTTAALHIEGKDVLRSCSSSRLELLQLLKELEELQLLMELLKKLELLQAVALPAPLEAAVPMA